MGMSKQQRITPRQILLCQDSVDDLAEEIVRLLIKRNGVQQHDSIKSDG